MVPTGDSERQVKSLFSFCERMMDTNLKTVPGVEAPKPSEVEVVQALAEIEQASAAAPAKTGEKPKA